MNYIKELNAFYVSMEYNPLSNSAIALWHALMHINNRTRWQREFRVAGMVLRLKSGLNESAFKRARTELKEKGYIIYEPLGGNQAPVYQMISLIENSDDGQQVDSVVDRADECFAEVEMVGETGDEQGGGVKAKETDAVRFYKENFGDSSPYMEGELKDLVDDVGEALVIEAMKRTLEQGITRWSYVLGVLHIWEKKGIRSVDAARAADVEFRNGRQRQYHYFPRGKREIIPDWFEEQKETRKRLEEPNRGVVVDPEEAEAVRLEIKRLREEMGYS
ncbi:DnaD domain-containing protein [Oceanobacillus sp. Castelsardo]|uniref:DnaD domain-containing protein n=1 Tax=Oceanobacillus sp. Castelsardo TaxID=1851204 RepID=UPI0008386F63|nr:DnaD domain protein [Oceanobacillus sp. Castelsardo]